MRQTTADLKTSQNRGKAKAQTDHSESITNSWHISEDEVITILNVLEAKISRSHCQVLWILISLRSPDYNCEHACHIGVQALKVPSAETVVVLSFGVFWGCGLRETFRTKMCFCKTAFFATHLCYLATAVSTWKHFLPIRRFVSKIWCQPPINTRLQIPEDNHSLISNISQVMKIEHYSLYDTHKHTHQSEQFLRSDVAPFYFSDFHVQFRWDNAVLSMYQAINSHE